jgi:hypothetical protein
MARLLPAKRAEFFSRKFAASVNEGSFMKKRQPKTMPQRPALLSRLPTSSAPDLSTLEPDALRDQVRKALLQLQAEERAAVIRKLVAALGQKGFGVGQCLLLLGIPAQTPDELTASEIATLIRYIRINEPELIRAIAPVLDGRISPETERAAAVSHAA